MRAVILEVTERELEYRRKVGLDRWDEMWEGVLHMVPAPSYDHQRMFGELIAYLMPLLRRKGRGTIVPEINVFDRADNYRIPELVFVATGRESVLQQDGAHGGPDAVVEIRSPNDETYEKFPMYAKIGVREVVVIDRDTKKPEIFRLAGSQLLAVSADRDGWLTAETMRVRFRAAGGKLVAEDLDEPSERVEI